MQFLLLFSLTTFLSLFQFDGWREDIQQPQAKQAMLCEGDVLISVKVFLQGPYDATTHLMKDNLRTHGVVGAAGYDVTGAAPYIPLANPYSPSAGGVAAVPGFTHPGNEVTTSPVFTTQGSNAIIDWVLIELYRDRSDIIVPADPPTPLRVLAGSRAALLQADGDVVDVDGTSPVKFPTAKCGDYYVLIRHRNSLGARTNGKANLNNVTSTLVDFTSSTTAYPAVGTNPMRTVETVGTTSVFALYAGNVLQENSGGTLRQLKYSGSSNDRGPILTRIGGASINATVSGYYSEDVNLNGEVKYSGSANDRGIILTNVGGASINATLDEQL
jgi:hypothetical protein